MAGCPKFWEVWKEVRFLRTRGVGLSSLSGRTTELWKEVQFLKTGGVGLSLLLESHMFGSAECVRLVLLLNHFIPQAKKGILQVINKN